MREKDGHFTHSCFAWPILEQGAMRLRHLPCGPTVRAQDRGPEGGGGAANLQIPASEVLIQLIFHLDDPLMPHTWRWSGPRPAVRSATGEIRDGA